MHIQLSILTFEQRANIEHYDHGWDEERDPSHSHVIWIMPSAFVYFTPEQASVIHLPSRRKTNGTVIDKRPIPSYRIDDIHANPVLALMSKLQKEVIDVVVRCQTHRTHIGIQCHIQINGNDRHDALEANRTFEMRW